MATIDAKLKSVRVLTTENGSAKYRFMTDQKFPGIVKKDNDGVSTFVEEDVEYFDLYPSEAVLKIGNCVDEFNIIYTARKENALRDGIANGGISAAQLTVLFRKCIFTIERVKLEAGEEYEVNGEIRTHDYDGYNTNIVDIKLTDAAEDEIDAQLRDIVRGRY